MREETQISFLKIKENPEYDAAAKEFFKNCEVIAPILKATVEEYKKSYLLSSYKIVRTDIVGKCDEPKEDYDLMEGNPHFMALFSTEVGRR